MKKYYNIAGIEISLDIPDDRMFDDERSLKEFSVDEVSFPHEFTFIVKEKLTPPETQASIVQPSFRIYYEGENQIRYIGSVQETFENAYIRACHNGKKHDIELQESHFSGKIGVHTVLNTLMMEHLVAEDHGFIFHTSFIEHDGGAILFTAPSGTGKSTQADLWNQYEGATIINGDRAVIKYKENTIYACGIPFAGSSIYCKNRILPLKAVVYLEQAKNTSIRKLRGVEAFRKIWEGVSVNTWDKLDVSAVSDVVTKLVLNVPVYLLSCTPDESAVIAVKNELSKL